MADVQNRTKSGLPRYVGEPEVREALGVARATLHRMRTANEFPAPERLSANRVAWKLDTVLEWIAARDRVRDQRLQRMAVTDPSKLKPDQVADALQDLGARHVAALTGSPVAAADIEGVTVKLTDDERQRLVEAAARQQQDVAERLIAALAKLHIVEALMLQRAFLPPLARAADGALQGLGLDITLSEADWRGAGVMIVERLMNDAYLDPTADPGTVAKALAGAGILGKKL